MGSQHRPIGLALGVLFLASCAGSSIDEQAAAPQPETEAQEAAAADSIVISGQIAVTGSRTKRANQESAAPVSVISPYAPPPPPPAPGMAPG